MVDKNNNKNSNNSKPFQGAEKLLNHIYLDTVKKLKPLVSSYFQSIDDLLFTMAEKSSSDQKQKLYFESLKSIRVHKFNVLSSFFNSIKHTFDLFGKNEFSYFEDKVTKVVKKNNSVTESFDKNDVDEKLTQNALIHKSTDEYQEQLLAFDKRFSLLAGVTLEPYHIPIGPFVLISSFAKSLRLLHLDLNVKLILYKHFEHSVMESIGELYKQTNQYLNNNGVMVGIENHIAISMVAKKPKKEKTNIPKEVVAQSGTLDQSSIFKGLGILQNIIIEELSKKNPIVLPPVEVEQALLVELYRSKLMDESCQLEQYDKDTINLVAMLFQLIFKDRNLSDSIRYSLLKLQIPFLKAAILDNKLLANKLHPAKLLLDKLSQTSVGWSSKLDENKSYINKLDQTVTTIAESVDLSEEFFYNLYNEFNEYLKQQHNNFETEQKRIKIKTMGRAKIVSAMKTVEALLLHKMENVTMPDLIRRMLFGSWKNLLSLLLVRHSNSSEKYILMVSFIDELIKLIESEQYDVVIQANILKLRDTYEEGLTLVAYSGEELLIKVNEFEQCLLKVHSLDEESIKNNQLSEDEVSNQIETKQHTRMTNKFEELIKQPAKFKKNSDDLIHESEKINEILDDLEDDEREFIDSIKIGMWFEFARANNSPVKAQLSWTNPTTGKYLFVNSRGLKVTDRSIQQLINDMNNQVLTIIEKP